MAHVRKDQRLMQRDIADYMGVSLATVRKWEDGTARVVREALGLGRLDRPDVATWTVLASMSLTPWAYLIHPSFTVENGRMKCTECSAH